MQAINHYICWSGVTFRRWCRAAILFAVVDEGSSAVNFERLPDNFEAGFDGTRYRQLMRHQAVGVSVVATGVVGRRVGLTATSVASLSDAPPKLLVCVGRATQAHNIVCDRGFFSVNFLASDQQELAERFAGRRGVDGEDRFQGAEWDTLETGAPVLKEALSNIDCRLLESHTFTTHSIFIGRVVAGRSREDGDPLIYFRGGYRGLAKS